MGNGTSRSDSGIIGAYWHGQGPLWKIFWLWGVVGSWILAALFLASTKILGLSWILYGIVAVVMIGYTAWILVSVWRCAENAPDTQWRTLARVLTVFWTLNVLLVGGFLGLDLLAATLR